MLWYLMLSQEQANELNRIMVPIYCVFPTIYYVPAYGGLFPYVDGSVFANSINDEQISPEDRGYIAFIMTGKKTYEEAIAAGWIEQPNDG